MKKQANNYVKGWRRIVSRLRTAWGVLTHKKCAVVFVEKNVDGKTNLDALFFGLDVESACNVMEAVYDCAEDVAIGRT